MVNDGKKYPDQPINIDQWYVVYWLNEVDIIKRMLQKWVKYINLEHGNVYLSEFIDCYFTNKIKFIK